MPGENRKVIIQTTARGEGGSGEFKKNKFSVRKETRVREHCVAFPRLGRGTAMTNKAAKSAGGRSSVMGGKGN